VRIFILLLVLLITGCASKPNQLFGVDNPKKPAAEVAGTVKQTVYLATSRQQDENPEVLFSGERNLEGPSFAKVDVYIPPDRELGRDARPSRLPPDPEKDFVILNPVVFPDEAAFKADLDRTLSQLPPEERQTMLFVHGFNTDVAGAVLLGARISHDSGFAGVPVVFSWASRGKLFEYVYDLNSSLIARDDLLETATVVATTKTTGINVVAHSMGNFLTVEAMRQNRLLNRFDHSGKLRTIVLASPDIDADVFAKQLAPFSVPERNFYVLISANDRALAASRRIAGGVDRVGDEQPSDLEKLGVTVIDLTKIEDTSSLNHTKFADSPEIVQLLGNRLNAGDSFGTRPNLLQTAPAAATVLTGSAGNVVIFD